MKFTTDSHFYHRRIVDGVVCFDFQAGEHAPVREITIPILNFLDAAQSVGVISAYDEPIRKVYISDDYEGTELNAREWVEYFLEDGEKSAVQGVCRRALIDQLKARAKAVEEWKEAADNRIEVYEKLIR